MTPTPFSTLKRANIDQGSLPELNYVPLDYYISVHQSPFYRGQRPQVSKVTGIRIRVGDRIIPYQTQPFILGGRTLSHIRPLAEAMGATVAWDDASQMVTLTAGGRTAQCQVGSEVGLVNGQGYFLDEPPVFIGQHVVVPVRFVAEALGYRADYDPAQKLVTLTLNR